MLTNLILIILFVFLSTLTAIFPATAMLPLAIYNAFDFVGQSIATIDTWIPGLPGLVLEMFFVIILCEFSLFSIIYKKSIINWIRGTGRV